MIVREDKDGIAVLVLEHGKANALDVELLDAMSSEIGRLSDDGAPPVVLTARSAIFSAGVDLQRVLAENVDYVDRLLDAFRGALRAFFAYPGPMVVASSGHAIAGGCILVETGDHRIMASDRGRIGIPELTVGVPFPATALEILRYAIPRRFLQRLVYGGETFEADEALELGLVDEMIESDRLLDEALSRAARLGAIARDVYSVTKQALRAPAIANLETRGAVIDETVGRIWRDPASRSRIEDAMRGVGSGRRRDQDG